jgi:nucleotide-binding universal stress UspA family protein
MLPIHTVLHPTDFSDHSAFAASLAGALARDYGARLVVLHVAQFPPAFAGEGMVPVGEADLRAEGAARLNALPAPRADVRAERRLEVGDPATEILRVAAELPADLIVMGTHGRTGLGRLLLGSVAELVVRRAACPVLTVSRPAAPEGRR